MAYRWNKPDIPHKGWRCTDVIDLGPGEYDTCEMCGNYPIRFVHVMEHDDHDVALNVGCVCAEHMSNDYVNPKARETQLKNKATRKRNWLSLKWKTSRKGNPYLKKDGMTLTVFPNKFKSGHWKYCIDGDFGEDSYPTEEAAKLALFEPYYEKIILRDNSVSGPTEPQDDEPRDAFGISYFDYQLPDDMGGGTLREREQLGTPARSAPKPPEEETELGENTWYYSEDRNGRGRISVFANALGACSTRHFDAETGTFIDKRSNPKGNYQDNSAKCARPRRLHLSKQPDLANTCKRRLPEVVLVEFRSQIRRILESEGN